MSDGMTLDDMLTLWQMAARRLEESGEVDVAEELRELIDGARQQEGNPPILALNTAKLTQSAGVEGLDVVELLAQAWLMIAKSPSATDDDC